jgi:hypothetical protein
MIAQVVDNPIVQKSMFMVVHDEMNAALNRMISIGRQLDILDTFELLFQIVVEERCRLVESTFKAVQIAKEMAEEDDYPVHESYEREP